MRNFRFVLLVVAGLFAAASQAPAQSTYTWNLNADGTWDTATANWLLAGAPAAYANGPNTAVFGPVITGNRTLGVQPAGVTAGSIQYTNTGQFTYTHGTAANNGTITLNAGGATNAAVTLGRGVGGTATYSGTGGNTITANSPLTFANNLAVTNNGTFGVTNFTVAGAVTGSGANGITVGGQGNSSFSGAVTGFTGGITKVGAGTFNLTNASNTFSGTVAVNGGVLAIGATDAALGNAANGVTIAGGAALRFASTVTSPRGFTVTGTAANPSRLDLASGTTTTLTGNSASTGLVGSGTAQISVTNGTTSGNLSVEGAQTGFTGGLVVGAPNMQLVGSVAAQRIFSETASATLRLQNAGTLPNATSITVSNGGALSVIQPTTAVTGRLNGTAPITLNNGRFIYNSSTNGGAAVSENFGPLSIYGAARISAFTGTGTTGGTTVTFAALNRDGLSALYFTGSLTAVGGTPGSTTTNYKVTGMAPLGGLGTTSAGVIPWATLVSGTVDPNRLVTYDTNGFRPLVAGTEVVTVAGGGSLTAGANNDLQGTITLPGDTAINALLNSSGTPTINGSGTLTVTSGGMSLFNGLTINGPNIRAAAGSPLYWHLGFPGVVTGATSQLLGDAGVSATSLSGTTSRRLTFSNTTPGGNPFTGGLSVNGNTQVVFTLADNQLGAVGAGNGVALNGGQLIYIPTAAATTALDNTRTITVGASNGTIGTGTAASTLQIPGTITGSGQVQFGGAATSSATGVVQLTGGANTYTGGTVVSTGTLNFTNSNQLGSGPVLLNGGTIQPGASLGFTSAPTVVTSSTIDTPAGVNLTLSGGLGGSGGTLGTSALSNTLTKTGPGTLTIAGDSTYAGNLTLSTTATADAGIVTISGSGAATELGAVTLQRNAVFNVDDTGGPLQRTGRTTNLTVTNSGGTATTGGSTVNLTTRAGGGSAFVFGTLAASGGAAATPNTSTINVIDGGAGANTVTFTSLTAVPANNTLNLVGTTNFGIDVGPSSGSRMFFQTAPGLLSGAIPNVGFTGFGGSGQATYDSQLGVLLLQAISGTFIDNIVNVGPGSITPTGAAYTTTGATTANLGAVIKSLTIGGHTVTLVPGVRAPQPGNLNTAADTLILSAGGLTSNTAANTITAGSAAKLQFNANAAVFATTDLTIDANVTLMGTAGLTKSGAGILTVNGPNQLGGVYTLTAGTVNLNTGATIDGLAGTTGTVNLAASQTLTFSGAATSTYSGVLAAPASSTVNLPGGFTGTQVLSAPVGTPNAFLGNYTISGGTLAVGGAGGLGADASTDPAGITVNSGGTLAFQGGITIPTAVVPPISIAGAGATGRFGAIDNLGGTNTFSGPITLTAAASIGATSGTVALTGPITASGNALTFTPQTGATVNLNPAGATALNLGTNQLTVNGTGTGTVILPNLANTIGNQVVNGGLLQASADNNLGATSNSLTLNGGGFRFGANFSFDNARPVSATASGGTIDTNGFDPTISGTLTIPAGAQLTKAGTGTLNLSPANSVSSAQAVVSGGTLLLGNANAAGLASNYRLNGGTLDLNGNNASLAPVNILAGTANGLLSSGATSTITLSGITADTTLGVSVGGNVTFNKSDNFVVTLTGTTTLPVTTTGVVNVNAGTLVTSVSSVSGGMSFNVANGATQSFGSFGNNNTDTGAYSTLTTTGGTFAVTGGSGDLAAKNLVFTGGNLDFTGTTNFWWHLRTAGASIVTNAAPTTVTFTGPTSGSRMQNDSGAPLLMNVASGTTPSGIDLNVNMLMSSGGNNAIFNKQGAGLMQLSFPGTNTASYTVNGGTLQVASGTTVSGTMTVNAGGRLRGTGIITGVTALNAGATLAPGTSIGTLTVNNTVTFNGSGANPAATVWQVELNGVAPNTLATAEANPANVDRLVVGGAAANNLDLVGGAANRIRIDLTQLGGTFSNPNDRVYYQIATVTGGGVVNGFAADVFEFSGPLAVTGSNPMVELVGGNTLVVSFIPVPEPATVLAIGAAGLAAVGAIRRRRTA